MILFPARLNSILYEIYEDILLPYLATYQPLLSVTFLLTQSLAQPRISQ